ncbi:MAG: glycosyltransferase, partial [Bacteroidales bacterium]|nr:glycosyltransferase [Bacteroidales bacterium]
MKYLILCNKSPYPPVEGGSMGMYAMIEGLCEAGHDVKVLSMNTNKYFIDPEQIPQEFRKKTNIEFIEVKLSINPLQALLNLFSSRSIHIERFETKAFSRKVAELLKNNSFDIVQLEFLYMSPYIEIIRKYSDARIVLRSHNIEHQIWERITQNTKNPLKKLYLDIITKRLRKYETEVIKKYDGIITVSNLDSDFYRKNGFTKPLTDVTYV